MNNHIPFPWTQQLLTFALFALFLSIWFSLLVDPLASVQLGALITHGKAECGKQSVWKAECVESRVCGHDTDRREGVVVGIPKLLTPLFSWERGIKSLGEMLLEVYGKR